MFLVLLYHTDLIYFLISAKSYQALFVMLKERMNYNTVSGEVKNNIDINCIVP